MPFLEPDPGARFLPVKLLLFCSIKPAGESVPVVNSLSTVGKPAPFV